MEFIKTKSSYVKQTKHSITNDGGVIFERDNSTLGGLNVLNSHQYPIYESGNFVISVDDTTPVKKKVEKISWESNGDSEVWTLGNMPKSASADTSANEANITFNRDFYKLQDFAYFGSLSELIKASISNIVTKFPGELYVPGNNEDGGVRIFYTTTSTDKESGEIGYHEYLLGDESIDGSLIVGNTDVYYISNPFNLNLHIDGISSYAENIEKYLLLDENWKNYVLINNNGEITPLFELNEEGTIITEHKPIVTFKFNQENPLDNRKPCKGELLYKVDVDGLFGFSVFLGDNKQLYYLTSEEYLGYHLRPKQELYDNFINNCSFFESYLLTKKESNISNKTYYKATFEIIQETNNGYNKTLEDFVLPLDESGYNIAIESGDFEKYVVRLSQLSEYYDERFTDNLYRSMTHESIKNLDWTFTREYQEDAELEYVEGGHKMSNIIHLFGREFDEIKGYIDGINYINVLTYNNKNNLPDYFLTDCAELKGWELKNICPFSLTEYIVVPEIDKDGQEINKRHYDLTHKNETANTASYSESYDNKKYQLKRLFSQDDKIGDNSIFDDKGYSTIKPYRISQSIPFGSFVVKEMPKYNIDYNDYTESIDDIEAEILNIVSAMTRMNEGVGLTNNINYSPKAEILQGQNNVSSAVDYLADLLSDLNKRVDELEDESEKTIAKDRINRLKYIVKEYINSDSSRKLLHDGECSYYRILPYYDNKEYTITEIYNEFIRRLCLNASSIFKRKGTIEGIEEILAMFGLKSKRWVESLGKTQQKTTNGKKSENFPQESKQEAEKTDYFEYDYEIKEYTLFAKPIKDKYNEYKEETWINWYNGTKLINYENYNHYEGLPVSYESYYANSINPNDIIDSYEYHWLNENEKAKYQPLYNYVYPYFGNVIDGNPYYQMKGGWLAKSQFIFDKDNNILLEGEIDDEESTRRNIINNILFTETHNIIRSVDDLTGIKDFIASEMNDGDIMYVENLNDDYVIIDGFDFYKLEKEKLVINNTPITYWYFNYTITPNETTLGEMSFYHKLYVSNPNYDYNDNEEVINIDDLKSNQTVKVYIMSGETDSNGETELSFTFSDGVHEMFNRHILYFLKDKKTFVKFNEETYDNTESDTTQTIEDEEYTHYFILHNANNCNYYDFLDGWEQLKNTDTRYYRINAIIEKNKGNNPHLGHFNYDFGYEYVDYFNFLFKHALENNLINEDCFADDNYNTHVELMENIGFQHLVYPPTEEKCLEGYYEWEDSKVHAFCNLIEQTRDNTKEKYDTTIFFRKPTGIGNLCTESDTCNNFEGDLVYHSYTNDYHINSIDRTSLTTYAKDKSIAEEKQYGYAIKDMDKIQIHELLDNNNQVIIEEVDNITDNTNQIMNTKRVDIIFNMHFLPFDEEGLKEKKYIDDIILHYMEQMLPSNIICKVTYNYPTEEEYNVTFNLLSDKITDELKESYGSVNLEEKV